MESNQFMHEYLNRTPFLKVSGEIQVFCGTYRLLPEGNGWKVVAFCHKPKFEEYSRYSAAI